MSLSPTMGQQPIRSKLSGWLIFSACVISMGAIFWGYDIGIMSTIYASPGFKIALHHPSAGQTGLITAIFYAGQFAAFATISGRLSNYLGRRYAALTGVAVICAGAVLQTASVNVAMMVVGRIIAGAGSGIVSTAVPLYLSEVSPAEWRGMFVGLNQVGIVFGISLAFWIGYGYSFWKTGRGVDLEWRLSIAMQFVPAVMFACGVSFIPESPRWLVEQDRIDAATKSLMKLRGTDSPASVETELDEFRANILWHKEHSVTSVRVFFSDRALFSRLWRGFMLQLLQQMSGAGGIRFYLPTNFKAAGTSESLSLLASGIDGTVQVACTIAAMFIVDKFGRRHCLGIGAAIMAWCLLINGALQSAFPDQANHAANTVNILFIFVFTVGYSMGLGPVAWTYVAEIFPISCRSKGMSLSAIGSSIGAIIVGQCWPVAVASIGPKTYFIFMGFNVFTVFLVYGFYPETKHKTLEELDSHFGKANVHSETEATPDTMLASAQNDVKVETEKVDV